MHEDQARDLRVRDHQLCLNEQFKLSCAKRRDVPTEIEWASFQSRLAEASSLDR